MGVPPDKLRAIITWLTTFWEEEASQRKSNFD
jgi:hypothetical protein